MAKKIKVYPENGAPFEADLVMAFEIMESGNRYVVYTLNELLENNLTKLYVAGIQKEGNTDVARRIDSEEEWAKVKEIMKQILAGGN